MLNLFIVIIIFYVSAIFEEVLLETSFKLKIKAHLVRPDTDSIIEEVKYTK